MDDRASESSWILFLLFVLLSTEERNPLANPIVARTGCECPYVPETNNEAAVRSTIKPDAVGTPLTYESFTLYPICDRAGQHCRVYEPGCPVAPIVSALPSLPSYISCVSSVQTTATDSELSRFYTECSSSFRRYDLWMRMRKGISRDATRLVEGLEG